MPEIVMFDWRLDKAIANEPTVNFQPRYINIPEIPLKILMDAPPATYTLLEKDPLLQQSLKDETKAAFVAVLGKIVGRLKVLDDECGRSEADFHKYAETRKGILAQIDADLEEAKRDAVGRIDRRWTTLQQQKREYQKYRLGVGVKIVKGAAGLVGGGVAIAAAIPTSGATVALAVVGAYHALMEAGKTLFDCIKDAETVQKKVQRGFESLRDTYKKNHAQGVAREVAASTANALLKTSVTNVKTLEDDNKLWRGKLTHLRYLAEYLSKELNKLLEDADKAGKQLTGPNAPKVKKALAKVEADVNKLLTEGWVIASMGRRVTIQKSYADAEAGLLVQEKVGKALEDLKASRSGGVDWYDQIISFVVQVGLQAAGASVPQPPQTALQETIGTVKDVKEHIGALHEMVADHSKKVKDFEDGVKKAIEKRLKGDLVPAPTVSAKGPSPNTPLPKSAAPKPQPKPPSP
jgi:hypothetical protein